MIIFIYRLICDIIIIIIIMIIVKPKSAGSEGSLGLASRIDAKKVIKLCIT